MNGAYFKERWGKCPACGLSEPGIHTLERCRRVLRGDPIGGRRIDVGKKYDLDALPEPPAPDFKGEKPPPRRCRDTVLHPEHAYMVQCELDDKHEGQHAFADLVPWP